MRSTPDAERCGQLVSLWGSLLRLLSLVASGAMAGATLMGHHRRHRGSVPGRFAVEGCFNTFDVFAIFPAPATRGFMNNAECQSVCGERGFPLAATNAANFSSQCLCGNNYPSPLTQVDTGRCDLPCSPDQGSCFLFSCCGSRNGTLFTVSFSRPTNVLKQVSWLAHAADMSLLAAATWRQLLLRLAFDFQHRAPTFQAKVMSELARASPLTLLLPPGGDQASSSYHLTTATNEATCPSSPQSEEGLGVWQPPPSSSSSCMALAWAQAVGREKAAAACEARGGHLPIIEAGAENGRVAAAQDGCTAWLGLQRDGVTGEWVWDLPYQAWDEAVPAEGAGEAPPYECAFMDMGSGRWTMRPCEGDDGLVFVCQRPAYQCDEANESGWRVVGEWGYMRQRVEGRAGWREVQGRCRGLRAWVASPADAGQNEAIRRVLLEDGHRHHHQHHRLHARGAVLGVYRQAAPRARWRRDLWRAESHDDGDVAGLGCRVLSANGTWQAVSCQDQLPQPFGALCEQPSTQHEGPGHCTCPEGWHSYPTCGQAGGGCYQYILPALHGGGLHDWPSARRACVALGADLALADSEGEEFFLAGMLVQQQQQGEALGAWVGNGRRARRGSGGWTLFDAWQGEQEAGPWSSSSGTVGGDCAVMEGPSATWRPSACGAGGAAQCYLCQAEQQRPPGPAGAVVARRDGGEDEAAAEEWAVETQGPNSPTPEWSSGWLPVRLQSAVKGRYLGCDRATGRLTLLAPGDAEQQQSWFLLETLEGDKGGGGGEGGAFRLRQAKGSGGAGGFLAVTVTEEGEGEGPPVLRCEEDQGSRTPRLAVLRADRPLAALASRLLRLSITPRSSDLMLSGRTECSIAAWDGSPGGPSFRCTPRRLRSAAAAEGVNRDEVWLEQQALLILDRSRFLLPRVPVPESGTACLNDASVTGICTFAFGQGVTVGRTFTLDFNYLLFDTVTVNAAVTPSVAVLIRGPPLRLQGGGEQGGGNATATSTAVSPVTGQPLGGTQNMGGGVGGVAGSPLQAAQQSTGTAEATTGGEEGPPPAFEVVLLQAVTENLQNDLTAAFNNIYDYSTTKGYVETRNWQFTITSPPRSAASIELWYQLVSLTYRWRALFAARGSLRVLYGGQPLGPPHHSLGDVSEQQSLFFYIFGRYQYPAELSLTYAVTDLTGQDWPVPVPGTSVREDVEPSDIRWEEHGKA